MKKLNLITGILSCIFLYACNNNVPETMNELNEDMRKYIFTVKDYQWDDNGKSRTQVNSTGAFAWADNDTIGIVPEQGSQVYFAIDPKDAGSDQATFNGGAWGLKANSKYAAYFPFVQDIMLDRTKVPVDYTGQVIAGKTTDNLGFYDYMAARPTGTNESGGLNFEFKHLGVMTVLTFQVPTPGEVTQLILTAKNPIFPAKGEIDLTQDPIAITSNQEDLSYSLFFGVKDLVTNTENEEVTVYFMMPPVDLSAETLGMTITCGEENIPYQVTGNNLNFVAGKGRLLTATLDETWKANFYIIDTNEIKSAMEKLSGTKLRFMPNSTVISDHLTLSYYGMLYAVKNGEWLEFHTSAKEFRISNLGLEFDASSYFRFASLIEIDLNGVNTEDMIQMNNMFYKCESLESIDFGKKFNTGNTTDMSNMFYGCKSLRNIDFSGFDTKNVQNMYNMFYNCKSLQSIDLSKFNTESVTNMGSMFYGCQSLQTLNLSNFNTENVSNMNSMFAFCPSLQTLDLNSFNTKNVTDMTFMFINCTSLESLDLSKFNTANVQNMNQMFYGCQSLQTLDLSNFNTENVSNMNNMFAFCPSLQSIDLSKFNTENVTDMCGMFYRCLSLQTLDLSSFNTKNVTVMSEIFSNCESLQSINLSNFNTKSVTSMYHMFSSCTSLQTLNLSSFNTENVNTMEGMFLSCKSLQSIDLSNFNTKSVTNMCRMFSSCTSLQTLDLSSFNTENVNTMTHMFFYCSSLKELDLRNFNTEHGTNISYMFQECRTLSSLDLSSFSFAKKPNINKIFDNTGADFENKPTNIYVTEEGKTYLDSKSKSTGINTKYAKLVVKGE